MRAARRIPSLVESLALAVYLDKILIGSGSES
jgi:hypothetical protein